MPSRLTYENYPNLCRALVKGGSTGTSDGATTPGYTYDKAPSRFVDDLESATIEHGTPGMPKRAEMVLFNDATISADIDDAEAVWKFSGNLWMRKDEMMAATTGTATGGSTTTLVKTAAGWSVNAFAGAYVLMTGGATTANVGEAIQIASNSATTLTFVGALPNAVVNTDTFEISGVFTSGISDTTRERIARRAPSSTSTTKAAPSAPRRSKARSSRSASRSTTRSARSGSWTTPTT
jgi:hypothetical protein